MVTFHSNHDSLLLLECDPSFMGHFCLLGPIVCFSFFLGAGVCDVSLSNSQQNFDISSLICSQICSLFMRVCRNFLPTGICCWSTDLSCMALPYVPVADSSFRCALNSRTHFSYIPFNALHFISATVKKSSSAPGTVSL